MAGTGSKNTQTINIDFGSTIHTIYMPLAVVASIDLFLILHFWKTGHVAPSIWLAAPRHVLQISAVKWSRPTQPNSAQIWTLGAQLEPKLGSNRVYLVHYRVKPKFKPYLKPTWPNWTFFDPESQLAKTQPEFWVQNWVQSKKMGRVWPHYFKYKKIVMNPGLLDWSFYKFKNNKLNNYMHCQFWQSLHRWSEQNWIMTYHYLR